MKQKISSIKLILVLAVFTLFFSVLCSVSVAEKIVKIKDSGYILLPDDTIYEGIDADGVERYFLFDLNTTLEIYEHLPILSIEDPNLEQCFKEQLDHLKLFNSDGFVERYKTKDTYVVRNFWYYKTSWRYVHSAFFNGKMYRHQISFLEYSGSPERIKAITDIIKTIQIAEPVIVTPTPTVVPTPSPTAPPPVKTPEPTKKPTPTPKPSPTGIPRTYEDRTGMYDISDGEATFTGATRPGQTISIPAFITVNGNKIPVTAIANCAFNYDEAITTVIIGKNIKTIGKYAFCECPNLTTVKGGKNVIKIGDYAFIKDKSLKTLPKFPKLLSIGKSAFSKCTKLGSITLPKNLESIGKDAFKECSGLKNITVQTKLLSSKNVKSGAFKGIHRKATFKCPKRLLADYKKLFLKAGAPKTCIFK